MKHTLVSVKSALISFALVTAASAYAGHPVNINTASAEDIAAALDGVGLMKAEAIVAFRTDKGAFTSVDSVVEVNGIGQATLNRNRDNILLDDQEVVEN